MCTAPIARVLNNRGHGFVRTWYRTVTQDGPCSERRPSEDGAVQHPEDQGMSDFPCAVLSRGADPLEGVLSQSLHLNGRAGSWPHL